MLFWRKRKVEGVGSSDPAPEAAKGAFVDGLVQIKTDVFEAVVTPFSGLPHSATLAILLSPTPEIQFALAAQTFRDLLAPEKLTEFDYLTFNQVVPVIQAWVMTNEAMS